MNVDNVDFFLDSIILFDLVGRIATTLQEAVPPAAFIAQIVSLHAGSPGLSSILFSQGMAEMNENFAGQHTTFFYQIKKLQRNQSVKLQFKPIHCPQCPLSMIGYAGHSTNVNIYEYVSRICIPDLPDVPDKALKV